MGISEFYYYGAFYYKGRFKKILVNLPPFLCPAFKSPDLCLWPFVGEFDSLMSYLTLLLSMTSPWILHTRQPLWKCITLALRGIRSGNSYSQCKSFITCGQSTQSLCSKALLLLSGWLMGWMLERLWIATWICVSSFAFPLPPFSFRQGLLRILLCFVPSCLKPLHSLVSLCNSQFFSASPLPNEQSKFSTYPVMM